MSEERPPAGPEDQQGEPSRPAAPDKVRKLEPDHGGATMPPGSVLIYTYRIDALIGRGGMGEVYKAHHVELDTAHAIKMILPEMANDPKVVSLFRREASVLRQVRHPAVVGYDGVFRDENGRVYLVMEFVEGPSLDQLMRRAPLTVGEVRRLRDRVASGLADAHRQGVIHRDLSPNNIIVPGNDVSQAKIIDFGIAKVQDPEVGTIVGSMFAGRYSYASPEQVGMFGGIVDARSDIYTLGLVLAAAAVGKHLDMGTSLMSVIKAREHAPDLSAVPEDLHAELTWMLQPDPANRPASMEELLARVPTATVIEPIYDEDAEPPTVVAPSISQLEPGAFSRPFDTPPAPSTPPAAPPSAPPSAQPSAQPAAPVTAPPAQPFTAPPAGSVPPAASMPPAASVPPAASIPPAASAPPREMTAEPQPLPEPAPEPQRARRGGGGWAAIAAIAALAVVGVGAWQFWPAGTTGPAQTASGDTVDRSTDTPATGTPADTAGASPIDLAALQRPTPEQPAGEPATATEGADQPTPGGTEGPIGLAEEIEGEADDAATSADTGEALSEEALAEEELSDEAQEQPTDLPIVPVRVSQHPGFSRVVLDLPDGVASSVTRVQNTVIAALAMPARADLDDVDADTLGQIASIRQTSQGGGEDDLELGISVLPDTQVRYFSTDSQIIVDVIAADSSVVPIPGSRVVLAAGEQPAAPGGPFEPPLPEHPAQQEAADDALRQEVEALQAEVAALHARIGELTGETYVAPEDAAAAMPHDDDGLMAMRAALEDERTAMEDELVSLVQEAAASAEPAPEPVEEPPAPVVVAEPLADLDFAERRLVQRYLARLTLYTGAIDGVFGRGTRSGIERFQAMIGAEQTGELTERQFTALTQLAGPLPDPVPVAETEPEEPPAAQTPAPAVGQPVEQTAETPPAGTAAPAGSPFSQDLLDRFGSGRTGTGATAAQRSQWTSTVTQAILPCWQQQARTVSGSRPTVAIVVTLTEGGFVQSVTPGDPGLVESDGDYRAMFEAVRRAVVDTRCQPIPLPASDYPGWQTLRFRISG